jgi:hypothetical protein
MQVRTIYVLWALLFLCPITALAQESALTGGSEEPQKEAPAADKNSTVDSNKKKDGEIEDWSDFVELLLNPTPFITAFYVVFVIVVIILGSRQEMRRNKDRNLTWNAWATQNGFEFSPTQDDELLAKMQVFPLFNKGSKRRMNNVIKTKKDNVKMTFFVYGYSSGGGGHSYAIVAFEHDSLSLPKFTLRPTRGFSDEIFAALENVEVGPFLKAMGMPIRTNTIMKEIGFDQHPEFSKSFVLNGDDEPAIRNFFDREKLDFFAQRKEAGLEADHTFLIYIRELNENLKPEQIGDFLNEGYSVFTALGGQSSKILPPPLESRGGVPPLPPSRQIVTPLAEPTKIDGELNHLSPELISVLELCTLYLVALDEQFTPIEQDWVDSKFGPGTSQRFIQTMGTMDWENCFADIYQQIIQLPPTDQLYLKSSAVPLFQGLMESDGLEGIEQERLDHLMRYIRESLGNA